MFSSLLFSIILEVLAGVQTRKRKDISIGKEEVKLSLSADDMISHKEMPWRSLVFSSRPLLKREYCKRERQIFGFPVNIKVTITLYS